MKKLVWLRLTDEGEDIKQNSGKSRDEKRRGKIYKMVLQRPVR